MNDLRKRWDRFLFNNRDKGIPNLMLYICAATLIVYVFSVIDPSNVIYSFLCFNRASILRGQVWRLITYILVPSSSGIWELLLLFCYYSIGRAVETVWGTFKFNLFYLCGMLLMDIGAMLLGTNASTYYLNLSLFLALATMYPDNKVLLMYIIPIKMKFLAWVYLGFSIFDIVAYHDLSPIFALLNYFLFFGKDCMNVLPGADRVGSRHMDFRWKKSSSGSSARPNPHWADGYQAKRNARASGAAGGARTIVDAPAYHHKCTICGRTDVSDPDLEFRYCSKCKGYYCYCQDHIHNHVHITD